MSKCKYAGDKTDPGCAVCDGITMISNGNKYDCAKSCGGYEPDNVPIVAQEAKSTIERNKTKLKTNIIGCKSGITKEVNGIWYKFEAWEERVVSDGADVEKERQILFDDLADAVDTQMQNVVNSYKS